MKKFALVIVLGMLLMPVGCGRSSSPSNVGENADAQAMADYEASIKADQEASNKAEGAKK